MRVQKLVRCQRSIVDSYSFAIRSVSRISAFWIPGSVMECPASGTVPVLRSACLEEVEFVLQVLEREGVRLLLRLVGDDGSVGGRLGGRWLSGEDGGLVRGRSRFRRPGGLGTQAHVHPGYGSRLAVFG